MVNRYVRDHVAQSIQTTNLLAQDVSVLSEIAERVNEQMAAGHKVLICGNGGSAADAQHFAAELVGRYNLPGRPALPALALTVDTSILTAIANDFEFDQVFERQVLALGEPGDVLIGMSTSGNSPNVIRAMQTAKTQEMWTIGFTASPYNTNRMIKSGCADLLFAPISPSSAITQQLHQIGYHAVCDAIDHASNSLND